MSSKKNNNSHPKVKYHQANTNDEHEILIDDLFNKNRNTIINPNEKAFDFTSINTYESIFKYGSRNGLRRENHYGVNSAFSKETKNLEGIEKLIYYSIVGIFYLLLAVFFPISLIFCLKKVKQNESIVVYRLGRLKSPEHKPGYAIIFPLIDSYKRHSIVPKEFFLPNLQVINYENAIFDVSTRIRYIINDIVKMTNSLQDLNLSMKSITRGTLVNLLSKKDASKIEIEKGYLTQEIKDVINDVVKKWGVEIIELEITINGVTKDESAEANENPALKSITQVFKSLFNGDSSSSDTGTKPTTSTANNIANKLGLDPKLFEMLQGMTPLVVPPSNGEEDSQNNNQPNIGAQLLGLFMPNLDQNNQSSKPTADNEAEFSPYNLLKLLEPLLNENLVNEIQTVYEFQIRMDSLNKDKTYQESKVEIFHLDLKNAPKGKIGRGPSLFSKADCVIRLNDEDLNELLADRLKPFTAYMSGRIEIDGHLQDVFKLKKLIKSVSNIAIMKLQQHQQQQQHQQ